MADLLDCSDLTKVLVRSSPGLDALAVGFGLAARDSTGYLVVGYGYGEWLVLAPAGSRAEVLRRVEELPAKGLRSVVDVTHGQSVLRLSGRRAADLLSTVCPIDLGDDVTPDGAARRCLVGGLAVGLIRDDVEGEPSYLLVFDRSYHRSMEELLRDAGAEFDGN